MTRARPIPLSPLFAALVLLAAPGVAQQAPSAPDLLALDSVATATFDGPDLSLVHAEDEQRQQAGLPPRFAVPYTVWITPDRGGTWENLDADTLLWRLRIRAPGARSVNLGFGIYSMPPGGELWMYSADREHVVRPFTADDNEEHGQLWTPVVAADDVIVEVAIPTAEVEALRLELTQVGYGYRDFGPREILTVSPGSSQPLSQSCNVDVACPEGDPWRLEIPSVGVFSLGGALWCSGALINNARGDYTPYFLTARHCGVKQGNAPSLVVYWNYENSFCRPPGSAQSGQPGNGSLSQFSTGSTWRASYLQTDFTLLELDDAPDPAFALSWAGWDATGADASSAVGIHHPNTEEKRISFEDNPTKTTFFFENAAKPNGTHVRVGNWDQGTTEAGSSGSPLFNQDHRIIGQLDGGVGFCTSAKITDWYGKLAVSYVGGGAPSSSLKPWLDPDDTGVLTADTLPACPTSAVTFENGSNRNPVCLRSLNAPAPGETWLLEVDTGAVRGSSFSAVRVFANGSSGTFVPQGELLVDVHSTLIASSILPSGDLPTLHPVPIDDDPALVGVSLYAQAAVGRGDRYLRLCNSEMLAIGCAP